MVRVTPRASRDAVEALVDTGEGRRALAVRVRSAPSEGAANAAVANVLARTLDLPRGTVKLVAGETARLKRFRLEGAPDRIVTRLNALVKEMGG